MKISYLEGLSDLCSGGNKLLEEPPNSESGEIRGVETNKPKKEKASLSMRKT